MLRSPDDLLPADAPDEMKRFIAYWIERAGRRPMPAFEDVDPLDIPWALPSLFVVRVLDGGSDFTYRLVGETINERYGGSLAGRRISELLVTRAADQAVRRWRQLLETPAAYYIDCEHPTNDGPWIRARRVLLPLGPTGGRPDHILGLTCFQDIGFDGPLIADDMQVRDLRWVEMAETA